MTSEPAPTERPREDAAPAPAGQPPAGDAPAAAPRPVRWWRIAALVALIVGLLVLGKVTGLTAYLTTERIRTTVEAAGWWGALLLIALFCVGELVHVPGFGFVAAAVIAYGRLGGGGLGYVGALCSVSVSFFVVRGVGGKALGAIRWRFVQRILGHLDAHPVRTITILRLILWMAPQLNYALALSRVRYRDYLLGSALGLALPLAGMALLFDRIFN
ncbi:MAG: VTT domain-containing protein [Deltaproteobacteria bacterium]|nr:VTT domain-containing protein [Deltaproteobacteria bacterium]